MAKTKWGKTFKAASAIVAGVVAVPAAAVSGAVSAARGEGFDKGADKVLDPTSRAVDQVGAFGDEHSEQLTKATVWGVTTAVTGAAAKGAINQTHHHKSS
jgi:hypothetical protein